ncbi:hypothetical protein AB0O91_31075 [Kitasatospora sp. NPDC089797]|uniref:hypothetical protein n=1 Tax=Kitasatospora sp. NPDC089797 TaxID=3155298 RepID=UPI00341F13FB
MTTPVKLIRACLVGASLLAVAACGSATVGSTSAGGASTTASSDASDATVLGLPSAEQRRAYGVTVPPGATDVSYGFYKVGGGGDLWTTFKTGQEGLDAFLTGLGLKESDLNPGVQEFTDADLKLTGWSIDPTHTLKGIMAPAKEEDMKSPSHTIVVDYTGPGPFTVYVLAGKP